MMKYSVLQLICAVLTGASLVLSLLYRSCDFLTYFSAAVIPLAAVLVLLPAFGRKHPEWKRFSRALETWRLHIVRLAAFAAVFVPTMFSRAAGNRTAAGPAIIAMLFADFVYCFIVSVKLGFDRLGTPEAVSEEYPAAAKYLDLKKAGE